MVQVSDVLYPEYELWLSEVNFNNQWRYDWKRGTPKGKNGLSVDAEKRIARNFPLSRRSRPDR
jgi:hypothetical protein